ncbi:MAG: DNA polymerase II large subunit, partial [Candidatus Woesearchaeota archaeon]
MAESERMQMYFDKIEKEVLQSYDIANAGRQKGFDPDNKVDIKLAKNMAERVEGLISVVAPQLVGSGVTQRIIDLEIEYSPLDWRVALKIALEVAQEKFCKFKDKVEAMEVGIRTGFAYQTAGIVAAPLEGFTHLMIRKTYDDKEYFVPCYAGPIRGAGGTAAAFSLLLTDYIRVHMGYAKYDPSEKEISRYKTEIYDYNERVTNLQYLPSLEELDFLMRHLPIQVDGIPSETIDVSNYKDTPRVETNKIRGGICLVLAEGLSQKAPKLWKRLEIWGKEFGLEWEFLGEFLKLQKNIKSKKKSIDGIKKEKLSPNYTFIADLVAGRPVLTMPMANGGFRLRYGRSRTSGFSAASISPATMAVLDKFIAIGTQLKVERPGKAAAITSCDTIHGPVVLLEDGSVKIIESPDEVKGCKVKEILYMGDILFNYGDFSENGHILIPCGYNEEWWVQQLKKEMQKNNESLSKEKRQWYIEPNQYKPFKEMKDISKKYNIPLHPRYIYFWAQITQEQFYEFLMHLSSIKILSEKITIPFKGTIKRTMEVLGIPHLFVNNEFIVVEKDDAEAFLFSFGITTYDDVVKTQLQYNPAHSIIDNISLFMGISIKDKAGTFIGARMGRPEKAKMRELTGSPHTLYPVSSEGGRLRSFQSALEAKKITADFQSFTCPQCGKETVNSACEKCLCKTKKHYFCKQCGKIPESECKIHGKANAYHKCEVAIVDEFQSCMQYMGIENPPPLIKRIRCTSNEDHVAEYLGKGILRAKHDVCVNKDGTVRYDMSELPLTHFKPIEIGTSVETLKRLGYENDSDGNPLESQEQILEMFPQDIILPAATDALDEPSDAVLFRTTLCIDEMLEKIYKLPRFYNLTKKNELVGHLTICLAPHISAGIVGRIIGFSKTQGFFAHPLFHAALRRDCDGDEASVSLLMDGLLNFSRRYLPARIGARTMDAPLVLTSKLIPTEVDDQALGLDVVSEYPLELYEAAAEYKNPWDVKIDQIKNRVNTPLQYENMGFTHHTSNINNGVTCSAYKELPS